MADPAPLSSDELDRIEDALEDLEGIDAIDDASPRVRERLAAYRDLLALSREAMPLEEVPPAVLANVIAHAHEAVAEPAAIAQPAAEPRPSFWQRMRRSFLVPTLALAGTAALVLWIARPNANEAVLDRPTIAAKSSPTSSADAPATDASSIVAPEPAAAAVTEKAAESKNAQDEIVDDPNAQLDPLGEASGAAEQKVPAALPQAGDEDKEKPADLPASGWSAIERADAASKAGDCRSAREDYNYAAEDEDPRVRARAHAGLGLCDRAAGNTDAAEENFAKARTLDSTIGDFIDRRADKPYRASTKSSGSPRSKKKSKAVFPADPMQK
jgi:tetratricopeptide (TPR) repeat protein